MGFSLDKIESRLHEQTVAGDVSPLAVEIFRFVKRSIGPSHGFFNTHGDTTLLDVEWVAFAGFLLGLGLDAGHTCLEMTPDGLSSILLDMDFAPLLDSFPNVSAITKSYKAHDENMFQELSSHLSGKIKDSTFVGSPETEKVFMLVGNRLYLHRYWSYERRLAKELSKRARTPSLFFKNKKAGFQLLEKFFPPGKGPVPDWQKIAVASSLEKQFFVLSGGPGTGKTRTIAAMMAVMLEAADTPLEIALCAPTGKAASRLSESVLDAMARLEVPSILKKKIPAEALTIHRLLGAGRSAGTFRYHSENHLDFHVVVVDEASMVDLPTMIHLVDALREDSILILVGDKNQLASVETGSVLRDVCFGFDRFTYSGRFVSLAKQVGEDIGKINGIEKPCHELKDCIVVLEHNFRFRQGSGIDELSSEVNKGRFEKVFDILASPDFRHVRFQNSRDKDIVSFLKDVALTDMEMICSSDSASEALTRSNGFKILCGTRRGIRGVQAINALLSSAIFKEDSFDVHSLFKGLPIIINKNDYFLGLFNGDTGICWPDDKGRLKVFFKGQGGEIRAFLPSRLPSFEPAWAITVHRSQGSEYERVLLILPHDDSPLLGRELLYTAITRAKKELIIYGTIDALKGCVKRPTMRFSGLSELLWDN